MFKGNAARMAQSFDIQPIGFAGSFLFAAVSVPRGASGDPRDCAIVSAEARRMMRWLTRVRTAPFLAAAIVAMPGLVSNAAAQGGRFAGGREQPQAASAREGVAAPGRQAAAAAHEPAVPGPGAPTTFGAIPPVPVAAGARGSQTPVSANRGGRVASGHAPAVPPRGQATTFGGVPPLPVAGAPRPAPPPGRVVRGRRYAVIVPPVVYGGGIYPLDAGPVYPPPGVPGSNVDVYPPQETQNPAPPASGWLELTLAPGEAQVYIDGYYAGVVSDFNQPGGLAVEAGPHRVEIRAAGYDTASFDVRLTPERTLAYREDLQPTDGVIPRPTAPAPKVPELTTFYVIDNCYAGNVRPTEAMLRPGCDPAQVKTIVIRH
jgi:hypothetical protein